jgi:SNF2 family DNA or RNA helicase
VISLDLSWSLQVEAQSYDRVHRLGQTKSVTIERLVIKDTVEDRILQLQDKKKALSDGSLGEGGGQKIGRLTVQQLAGRRFFKLTCIDAL